MDEVLTKMIALNVQTSSIVKDSGFWRFLLGLNHNYVFPSPKVHPRQSPELCTKSPMTELMEKRTKLKQCALLWTAGHSELQGVSLL